MTKKTIPIDKDVIGVGELGEVEIVTEAVTKGTPKPKPITGTQKLEFGSEKYIPWGSNNLFPQDLIKIGKKAIAVPSTIEKITGLIYGGGVVFGKIDEDSSGNEFFKRLDDANLRTQIRQALRKFNIDAFVKGAALDLAWFGCFFPQVTSIDGKFAGAWRQAARKCRWIIPKDNKTEIKKAVVYSSWEDSPSVETLKKEALTFDVIDNENYAPDELVKKYFKANKSGSFIYKPIIPSVDSDWYNIPIWYSAVESKWLDYAIEIPKLKHKTLINQLAIKYVIYIDPQYWTIKYGETEWNKFSPKEQRNKKREEAKAFITTMKGEGGVNGTIIIDKIKNMGDREEYKLWTIERLDNPIQSGELIIDSTEAMNNVAHAFGMDPTIVGYSSGKNFSSSGSGSDKRVATNVQTSLMRFYQDLILKCSTDLMRDVNGLDPDIVFRMRNNIQLTLDQGKSQQESK